MFLHIFPHQESNFASVVFAFLWAGKEFVFTCGEMVLDGADSSLPRAISLSIIACHTKSLDLSFTCILQFEISATLSKETVLVFTVGWPNKCEVSLISVK